MNVKQVDIRVLKPYENNPRINDTAVDYVARSIEEFGFKVPIVIDANNVIVTGHTRYKAAQELGMETVPCIIADDLNEEQVQAFRIADNKVAEIAEWDKEKLGAELEMIDLDIDWLELDDMFEEVEMLSIDDEELGETIKDRTLSFDGVKIPLTEDEFLGFQKALNDYVDANSVSIGFVRYLLERGN